MKKIIICSFLILFAGEFASAGAAFIIKLKNGNYFLTERYWQDKGQVLFDSFGGVFGIDKGLITGIEQTNKSITLIRSAPDVQKETLLPSSKGNDNPSNAVVQSQLEEQPKGDQNDPIKKSFATLKEKMNGLDGMLTAEMMALLNEITAFKNMVAKNSKYFVQYGREFNDAQEMGALVETKLKSRGL